MFLGHTVNTGSLLRPFFDGSKVGFISGTGWIVHIADSKFTFCKFIEGIDMYQNNQTIWNKNGNSITKVIFVLSLIINQIHIHQD